jgi:hypothetical protein
MLHSQLKTKYPKSPFICDINNINNTVNTFNVTTQFLQKDELLRKIATLMTSAREPTTTDQETIDFLLKLTDNAYENIIYAQQTQKIPKIKNKVLLNFHTTAYYNDHGSIIDKEYETDIAWCIIPLLTNVSHNVYVKSTNQYKINTLNREQREILGKIDKINNDVSLAASPKGLPLEVDYGSNQTSKANSRQFRISKRGFVARNEEKAEKKDIFTSNDNVLATQLYKIEPKNLQILLTDKTRASAAEIRDRLSSNYKAYRYRNNPELYKQQAKLDTSLYSITDVIVQKHNNKYKSFETTVDCDKFDFAHTKIMIQKVNGIFRFNNAGLITLIINNQNEDIDRIYFISILNQPVLSSILVPQQNITTTNNNDYHNDYHNEYHSQKMRIQITLHIIEIY